MIFYHITHTTHISFILFDTSNSLVISCGLITVFVAFDFARVSISMGICGLWIWLSECSIVILTSQEEFFFARGVRMNYVKKGCSRWSNDISFSSFVNYVIAKMLMDFDWKKDISVYWKEFHFVSSEGSWCFSESTNLNHSFLFAHNPKCTIHVWFL